MHLKDASLLYFVLYIYIWLMVANISMVHIYFERDMGQFRSSVSSGYRKT